MEHLPGDILQTILEDCIRIDQIRVLSALDVAVCSRRCRGEFLAVLRQIRLKQPARQPSQHLANYVAWIARRGIRLPCLSIGRTTIRALVQELVRSRLLVVPQIHTLSFSELHVSPLLSFLPATKAIVWCGSLPTDYVLLQFRSLQLEGLDVSETDSPRASASLFLAIQSMRGTLRELKCAPDDQTLAMMASDCIHLRKVELNCRQVCLLSSITNFFQQRGEHLEEVRLVDCRRLIITNEVVQNISKLCRNLLKFHVDFAGPHCITTWLTVLANCNRLVKMNKNDLSLRDQFNYSQWGGGCYVDSQNNDKHRNPFWTRRYLKQDMYCPPGVKLWSLQDHHNTFANDSNGLLKQAADTFGSHLQDLMYHAPYKEVSMLYVLSRCSALSSLRVDCKDKPFSDACLSMLASHCPHITSLHLSDATQISDAGVISMLQAYQAMRNLDFMRCSALTDATLIKIAELFPVGLSFVNLMDTAITKEAVLDIVLRGKFKVTNMLSTGHEDWLKMMIEEAGLEEPQYCIRVPL